MATEKITIPVDAQAAVAYKAVPLEERKKIEALLGLWLRDLVAAQPGTLKQIMDEVSRKARARGLTPTILDSLLKGA
jgi:hypothetical protein